MCNPSPARVLRNVKRMTKFIERKMKSEPVLSVVILPQTNIYPTPQKVLTNIPSRSIAAKRKLLSCQTLQQINILPDAISDDNLIMSEFCPYCPECDVTYKREQVLEFREHCRKMHDWLWCENWYRGDGCEYATISYQELQYRTDGFSWSQVDLFILSQ